MSQNELQRVVAGREDDAELAAADRKQRLGAESYGYGYWLGKAAAFGEVVELIEAAQAVAPGGLGLTFPMSRQEVEQWIGVCNHEPARQVLRDYLTMLAAAPASEPLRGSSTQFDLTETKPASEAKGQGWFAEKLAQHPDIEDAVTAGGSHDRYPTCDTCGGTWFTNGKCDRCGTLTTAASSAADDAELPGMSHSDFTGGATDAAEQEQAGELPPSFARCCDDGYWLLRVSGTERFDVHDSRYTRAQEVYSADQMHAFYRKGYDAALLRRAARVEVDDAMVERALDAWNDKYEAEYRYGGSADNRTAAIRAALTAAIADGEGIRD